MNNKEQKVETSTEAAIDGNTVLWAGWISTEKELPSDDMDGEQILMCLDFQKSESLVLCGVWKDGQFHCLDTDDVYENVGHWACLPTCP